MGSDEGEGWRTSPLFFRCLTDGQLIADTQESMRAHLGHRVTSDRPTWWETVKLFLGWQP